MTEPILLIMAAGMGSRYGGLKQLDPMTDEGEIIIDFSLFDAIRAGFRRAVFIIKREMEEDMNRLVKSRAGGKIDITYVYQDMDDLPDGFTVPEGRVKPWGTSHAVWCARHAVDAPFAVINADDYYGPNAFKIIYDYLKNIDPASGDYAMAAYLAHNTLSGSGSVTRGVCETRDGMLESVTERYKVMRRNGAVSFEDEDGVYHALPDDCPVSMNFWGLTPTVFGELTRRFPAFMERAFAGDILKAEYLLPTSIDDMLQSGAATVRVLRCADIWHGVTYSEDKPLVKAALRAMKDAGLYPKQLWEPEQAR